MKFESGGNEKSLWKQCSRGKTTATNFNDCFGKIIASFTADDITLKFNGALSPFTVDDGKPDEQLGLIAPVRTY